MKTLLLNAVLFFSLNTSVFGGVCNSLLIGGNWNNPATWACGHVPGCGDDVIIPFGSVVTITANIDLSACPAPINISVSGELVFTGNRTLSLPAGSCISINLLGILTPVRVIGNTNKIIIDGTTEWTGTFLTLPVIGPAGIGCSPPSPLSVEATNFDVYNHKNHVTLSWETKSERDNDFFSIEFSADGNYWQELAKIEGFGSGFSSETQYYSYLDENPLFGYSYYRLSQTDMNGERKILYTTSNNFFVAGCAIFPVPANTSICIVAPDIEKSSVLMFNYQGEEIKVSQNSLNSKLELNCAELTNGVYFLTIDNDNVHLVKKIIVLHK